MRLKDNQVHVLQVLDALGGTVSYDQIQDAVDVRGLRRLRSDMKVLRDLHLVRKHGAGKFAVTARGREQLVSTTSQIAA